MASANTVVGKSSEPPPASKPRIRWHVVTAMLLALVLLALASVHARAGSLSTAIVVLSVVIACSLWCLHLETGSLRWYWSCSLAALVACHLVLPELRHATIPAAEWISALGCGFFVYVMLWVSDGNECEPGLRPLATFALLLSIGFLAKPAVAISCALLSGIFFLGSRRRFGGILGSALLLFTPSLLCVLAFVTLNILTAGALRGVIPQIVGMRLAPPPGSSGLDLLLLIQESPALWFSLLVLLARAFERRSGISDVAYFMLVAFLTTAGTARWMPERLSSADIRAIVYAGACCLLALAPPQSPLCQAMMLAGTSAALL